MDRQPVKPEHAARILRARTALAAAQMEWEQAVTAALKADASIREVATCAGISPTTVQKIGRENGWPTEAQKRRRAEEQAERDRFNAYVQAYRDQHPQLEQ